MTDQPWGDVIPWTAADREKGECPVPEDEEIHVIFGDGWMTDVTAGNIYWPDPDVIAYRRKVQPKWVTVYGHRNGKLGWSFSEGVLPYDLCAFRFPVGPDGKPCGDPERVEIEGET